MLSQITQRASSFDKNIIQASSYLPKAEQALSPLAEFLGKDFRVPTRTVKAVFVENIEPADVSYRISHGAVGQKLNVVSK